MVVTKYLGEQLSQVEGSQVAMRRLKLCSALITREQFPCLTYYTLVFFSCHFECVQ